jgi:hypothetical protein
MAATQPLNQNTPELVIRDAMRETQLLEKGANPTSEDYAIHIERLNALIQLQMTQGLKLFLWKDIAVTLVAGTQTYSISSTFVNMNTNPQQMREGYYLYPSGSQYPLIPYSWNEWNTLSTRSQQGQPTNFFVDKQATTFNFNLWPIPNATAALGTAHVLVRQRAPQMLQLNEQTLFPTEWFLWLVWALAEEICTGQAEVIVKRCEAKSAMYRTMLEGFDVEAETGTAFQPDPRAGYHLSRFR